MNRAPARIALLCLPIALAACGGGSSSSTSASTQSTAPTYAIGGQVSGLPTAAVLRLTDNGSDPVAVAADGSFAFPTPLAAGQAYAAAVAYHTPGLDCSAAGASGTVSGQVGGIQVTCAPGSYGVLYSFGAQAGQADGANPDASLMRDAHGNLFGTTYGGGAYGNGEVFELSPDGNGGYALNVLYSFGAQANQTDGANPDAPLVEDAQGNLFGTTNDGGAYNGAGVLFELSPNGTAGYTYSVVHSFGNGTDGQYPYGAPLIDAAGNLFGVLPVGGSHGAGMAYELSPDGHGGYTEADIYDFGALAGRADGANPQTELVMDSQGNLYGSAYNGGAHGAGNVFKLAPNGSGGFVESVLYDFGALASRADGAYPYARLDIDAQGNLYGTTQTGGAHASGTAFKLSAASGYAETVLYSFGALSAGADGSRPQGPLLIDAQGNLFGTTAYGGAANRGTVYKLAPDSSSASGYTQSVLYSLGSQSGQVDGAYPSLVGLVMDATGNLYGTAGSGGAHNAGVVFEIR